MPHPVVSKTLPARRARLALPVLPALMLLAACGPGEPAGAGASSPAAASALATGYVPLNELLNGATYQGFTGGLYPYGSNTMPSAHAQAGSTSAAAIRPLDAA